MTLDFRRRKWIFPITAGLAGIYLLQTATPLRLDTDSLNYLIMATAIADGRPVPEIGLPTGYSHLVAFLDHAGLGSSFFFVLANCLFLAAGLYAVWQMLGKEHDTARRLVVVFTPLAYTVVRSAAMPMPEPAFFCISLVVLALLSRSQRSTLPVRILLLLVATALTALSITVRIVGLILLPAILWACVADGYAMLAAKHSRRRITGWLAGICAVLLAIAIAIIGLDTFAYYAGQARLQYPDGFGLQRLYKQLSIHLVTIGELFVNLPYPKFRSFEPVFMLAGAAVVFGVLRYLRFRGPLTPLHVYTASFVATLLVWPHHAARLWMPLIPLFIALLATAERRFTPGRKSVLLLRAYLCWFILTGAAALAYTTRISLSGRDFSSVYGVAGGLSTPTQPGGPNAGYDEHARELMRRYGRGVEARKK